MSAPTAAGGARPTTAPPSGARVRHRSVPRSVVLPALAWALAACSGGGGGGTPPPTQPDPVTQVTLSAPAATVLAGATLQVAATARTAAGQVVTGAATAWSSSAESIARVDASGLVTGVSPGAATIRATVAGVTGTLDVTVVPQPVAAVAVSPHTAELQLADSVQLAATARDGAGNVLTGRPVTWTALDPGAASVTADGMVRSLATGQARVVAAVEGKADTATITVVPRRVASVAVSPRVAQLQLTDTMRLAATVRGDAGDLLTGRPVTWAALDPGTASVTADGVVRGLATGQARVVAAVEGKADTATVTVFVPTAERVQLSPRFATANVGEAVTLRADAFAAGAVRILAPTVAWSSTGGALAVDASGVATGSAPGVVRAVARVNAASDTAAIAVLGSTSLLATAFAGSEYLADARPGELVTVAVTLDLSRVSANGDLGALQMEVRYDPAMLAFETHAAVAHGVVDVFSPAAGTVRIAFAETTPQGSGAITLVRLGFRVAAAAPAGARTAFSLLFTGTVTSTAFSPYPAPLTVGGRVRVVP